VSQLNSGHHTTGRLPPANGIRSHSRAFGVSQIRSHSRAFGVSQIRSQSMAFGVSQIRSHSRAFGVSQVRSQSMAFGVSQLNSGHHTTGRLLPANGTLAITEPDTCPCKFNSGHHGTGRLPHANGASDPTWAFVVSALGSMLWCYACIYV
jgi:hypothetical protein